ncbi:MAG: response regulator transcription factor [Candidatus Symbiothrix sp.]|jgi:DNA-binding NarL/FixJ family response regulator|nr:response regulator transcription factor [Candidatus Symbiothrix sp.]
MHSTVILADNQDITAAGIYHYIQSNRSFSRFSEVRNKRELIEELFSEVNALVILDYSLFDFTGVEELLVLQTRFPLSHFLLFSEELTDDFVKHVTCNKAFSILLKDCTKEEVNSAIESILNGRPFVCNRITNHLSSKKNQDFLTDNKLTATEREILRLIAAGKNTREIAAERFLSVHTVITHRKNIFRKLEVNNLHEATKYALRAGIIDASDYYI